MSDSTCPAPTTNRERVERILDLTIEKLERSLADTERPSPALITAVIRLAREFGIDLKRNGEPTSPAADSVLESLNDLDPVALGIEEPETRIQ